MKRFITVLIILISCDLQSQDLDAFKDCLGKQEYQSLELAVKTWENFLQDNYDLNIKDASHQFITTLLESSISDTSNWIFELNNFDQVLKEIKNSGLQDEIWIYSNEEHYNPDILSYVNSLKDQFNIIDTTKFNSEFEDLIQIPPVEGTQNAPKEIYRIGSPLSRLSATIHKYSTNEIIKKGAEIDLTLGSISPYLIMNALLNNSEKVDYNDFITKAFIVQKIFYDFMILCIITCGRKNKSAANN